MSLLLALALACQADPSPDATASPLAADVTGAADVTPPEGTMTPPPYTAQQLQAACPAGRRDTFRVTTAAGKTTINILHFIESDDTGATFLRTLQNEQGAAIGLPTRRQSTWAQLRAHAAFPVTQTTAERATVTVPAGTFASQHVTVQQGEVQVEYWFADDLPGPPVQMIEHHPERGDKTTVLVAHELQGTP